MLWCYNLRRYNTAACSATVLQRCHGCGVVARGAATLQCCSAAVLQFVLLQRCGAAVRVVAALWCCDAMTLRCYGVAARQAAEALLVLWRCGTVAAALYYGVVAAALYWCRGVAAEFYFILFYSTALGETKREREGETLKPVQRSPLWQECNTQALSNTQAFSNTNASSLEWQQNQRPPAPATLAAKIATTITTQEFSSKYKSVAFNMRHRKCSFSRMKMYCKEVVKAYVNDGRVVATVSI
jgi:hypothetical protein